MQPPASLIALYHALGTHEATGYRDALRRDALAKQLDWLEGHYSVRPLQELVERRRAEQPLDGLAAITFDDNHRTVLEEALPLLVARGLPATWCLIGEVLQGRPYWRGQVHRLIHQGRIEEFLAFAERERPGALARVRLERFYKDSKDPRRCNVLELKALLERFLAGERDDDLVRLEDLARRTPPAGITLANHSRSHPVFAGLPLAEQAAEIAGGAAALASTSWPVLPVLALPFGDPESYDAVTLKALRGSACEALLLTAPKGTAADAAAHLPFPSGTVALTRVMLGNENLFSP